MSSDSARPGSVPGDGGPPGAGGGTEAPGSVRTGWDAPVQLIDAHGVRHADERYDHLVADIDGIALQKLYEDLVVVRRIDA